MESRIRYARTVDGADIAYAVIGAGKPLFITRALVDPAVDDDLAVADAPFFGLADTRSLVIWDHRGLGLSSGAAGFTLESSLADMDAVVQAIGADSVDLMAMRMSCHTAVAYAARQPARVARLVLFNPSPPGYSPRYGRWAGLPDIVRTHFVEYMQLAALRLYGWERGAAARRFVEHMVAHFTPESWEETVRTMEAVDASALAQDVRARTLVIIDLSGSGVSDLVKADRQAFMRRLSARIPGAELFVVRLGDESAWVERARTFLQAGDQGREPAAAATPSGTAIILFTDIADSTALTERMGDTAFRAASRALDESVRAAMREAGGTAVEGKVLGDGVMGVFTSAAQAIDAARRCVELSAGMELPLHIGLHAGDVIHEKDNVYGGAVNIASRICGLCAPGEILVSATVRDLARTSAGVTFEDRGEQALKGIDDPVRVFAVRWRE